MAAFNGNKKSDRYARYLDNLPTEFEYRGFRVAHDSHVPGRPWSIAEEQEYGMTFCGFFATTLEAQAEIDEIVNDRESCEADGIRWDYGGES